MKTAKEWLEIIGNEVDYSPYDGFTDDVLLKLIERIKEDTALYAVQALNSQSVKIGLLRWVKKINSKNVQPIT